MQEGALEAWRELVTRCGPSPEPVRPTRVRGFWDGIELVVETTGRSPRPGDVALRLEATLARDDVTIVALDRCLAPAERRSTGDPELDAVIVRCPDPTVVAALDAPTRRLVHELVVERGIEVYGALARLEPWARQALPADRVAELGQRCSTPPRATRCCARPTSAPSPSSVTRAGRGSWRATCVLSSRTFARRR
ncbi:MAG: hypothetical protein U1F43_35870 [Myxococcota bacterium]